jgi:hypothetical protein
VAEGFGFYYFLANHVKPKIFPKKGDHRQYHLHTMSKEIFILFLTAIGLLGFFVTAHLLIFRSHTISTKLLGGYTLLLTVSSLEPVKQYFSASLFVFEILVATCSFMIGPVLYLYCKYRILNYRVWNWKDVIHFIPAGIIMILMLLSSPPQASAEEQTDELIFYG